MYISPDFGELLILDIYYDFSIEIFLLIVCGSISTLKPLFDFVLNRARPKAAMKLASISITHSLIGRQDPESHRRHGTSSTMSPEMPIVVLVDSRELQPV